MYFKISYLLFAFFYWSWVLILVKSIDVPKCATKVHYCMMENGSRAVDCGDTHASVLNEFSSTNRGSWTVVPTSDPFCRQSPPRILELDEATRTNISSLHARSNGLVTFVCLIKDVCLWKIAIVHVVSLSQLLNVSLVYQGDQLLGEKGTLSCTINWAKNDAWVKQTWFKNEKESLGSSVIHEADREFPPVQKYHITFESLSRKNAQMYQCGARGLAFDLIPIQFTAWKAITIRTRVNRSVHSTASLPFSPFVGSSVYRSLPNGTWTSTETMTSSVSHSTSSKSHMPNSMQMLNYQQTQSLPSSFSYESPSTPESSLWSSRKPGISSSYSWSNTSKDHYWPSKLEPCTTKSLLGPTKVKPIINASRRVLRSIIFLQLFTSGSLVTNYVICL